LKTPFAWQNFRHGKIRSLLAVVGIAFPLMLIFVQLALHSALLSTGHLVYDGLRFDIVLLSKEYIYLAQPGGFPRSRLFQAAGVAGVDSVAPVYLGVAPWRNPEIGTQRLILVIGFDPRRATFTSDEISELLPQLKKADTVMLDRQTRPEFGPQKKGLRAELGHRQVEVVGLYDMGTGFAAYGGTVSVDVNFERLFPGRSLETVNVGLISLADSADPEAVVAQLRLMLPEDIVVLRRSELLVREEEYWDSASSVGIMLGWSVLVDAIVGAVILYQVLSADVLRRLREYSTLLALGYGQRYLYRSVIAQALIVVSAAFIPALLLAVGVCRMGRNAMLLPMEITMKTGVWVMLITLGLATFASTLSIRKLAGADPADLF
jgi:putative ABC transport system permease protein